MCQSPHHRHVKLGFCDESFPEGTHICYLFSDRAERLQVTARYLHSAIEQGEQASFFHDALAAEELQATLRDLGVAGSVLAEARQLLLAKALPTYCPDGRFTPEAMWARLQALYVRSREAGFSGARVCGEMTWALAGMPGSERLLEYEAGINEVLRSAPLNVLCQYDATRFDGATLRGVLDVHPLLLVQGQIVRNPYYRVRPSAVAALP